MPIAATKSELERDIRRIPWQTSGISLKYFWMLAGFDQFIKPDRMVLRFLQTALGRAVATTEAETLLSEACDRLRGKYPGLTPYLLDHEVWKYQRAQRREPSGKK